MVTTLKNPDFLTDSVQYDASAVEWRAVWDATDDFVRKLGGWTSPWLDESWRDGNPIFSAWSPRLRRGVRVIQHSDPSLFLVERRTFGGRGTPDAVDELMISCALTSESLESVARLLERWITDQKGVVTSGPQPRGPLSTEGVTKRADGGEPLDFLAA
jgi:hypothetical protein